LPHNTRSTRRTSKNEGNSIEDSNEVEEAVKTDSKKAASNLTRKKSAFNRITDMITKSPILEPLRSEKKIYFLFLFNLNPFFCISLPISMIFYFVGIKFFSIINKKDRPTRQTKLKASSSNVSDFGEVAKEAANKVTKSKSILSSIKQNNISESLKKIKV
jgi:hypothetical protein